jgi:hyperosmotically inducible protein
VEIAASAAGRLARLVHYLVSCGIFRTQTWSECMRANRLAVPAATVVLMMGLTGCANTARGVKSDAENITEKVAAGAETVDVKAALIADGRVDATNINVDTNAETKTVVLKGTVPTAEQRAMAEKVAQEQAKGYKITNTLTVAPKAQ